MGKGRRKSGHKESKQDKGGENNTKIDDTPDICHLISRPEQDTEASDFLFFRLGWVWERGQREHSLYICINYGDDYTIERPSLLIVNHSRCLYQAINILKDSSLSQRPELSRGHDCLNLLGLYATYTLWGMSECVDGTLLIDPSMDAQTS